ncbi:dihydrolipoyl dehydrogenase [candidate division KSB3 bacterium]|uniref:Dihydrolipoyl dehydrogenase n=1 Tax=candidate division KSB3 bacterium TaxID=2044937 RepID=A0A2G6E2P6_9BACT|nr:MAG: dihydrolipoyl dehydrogenase [candidate division KSB3 bacterium]PIE28705.1 MAG: dihydrolipoyl dehydrogenase [candidate division KSB3 bacterium]
MYDIIVVGAGPGGYIAAERAGARGKSVLLVEKAELGGVCTNEGCIPTKSLLNSAKQYVHGLEADKFGVYFDGARFSLPDAMAWKRDVIETLRKGIAFLMKKNAVEVITGEAEFLDRQTILVAGQRYQGRDLIIATGSSAAVPPIPGVDSPHVMTNREILKIADLPERIVIIGGGYIGMEFASFFSNVGVEVHVVEMMKEIVPMMDARFSKTLRKSLPNVSFHLGAKVESIEKDRVNLSQDGREKTLQADVILMSVGRRPNVQGLEALGLDIRPSGIKVNEKMQTNVPGVYAVGDVNGESLLAHSASRMAEVAVNTICGRPDQMRYQAVPWVVYTLPEVAGCGLTEQDAQAQGIRVKSATVQMRANGRFLAEYGKSSPGLCKVVVEADTNILKGVHLLGAACSEMIYGVAALLEAELRVQDIQEIIFPHPTVSESIKDALWEI